LAVSEEGSLPRLQFKRKVFVAGCRLAVPFHELLPISEEGLRENANPHDSLILPECPVGLRDRIAVWRTL